MLNIFKPKSHASFQPAELQNICRICLHFTENFLSLYDNEIEFLISEFLPQKLCRRPLHPYRICVECFDEAKVAYIFKKQCEYADKLIKLVLHEPDDKKSFEKETQTDFDKFKSPRDFSCRNECFLCTKNFTRKEYLRKHIVKIHKVNKTFNINKRIRIEKEFLKGNDCQLCNESFNNKENVRKHVISAHNSNEKFLSQYTFEKNETLPENKYKITPVSLNNLEILKELPLPFQPENLDRPSKPLEKIEITEPLNNELEDDLLDEDPLMSFECVSVLDENLDLEEEYDEDEQDENEKQNKKENEKQFAKKTIKVTKELIKSMISESKKRIAKIETKPNEDGKYECEICKKTFDKSAALINHKFSHSEIAKPYKCTLCSESFLRPVDLKNHVNSVHDGIRPFKCSICQKSFKRNEHLQCHKNRQICLNDKKKKKIIGTRTAHNTVPEREYFCSQCGKSFTKCNCFTIHARMDTGERPYKCRYCGKAFPRSTDKHVHEREHRGEKKYECTECSKTFATNYKLRNHIRIHTGERPHKCTYCPRSFAKKIDLTKHLRQHTGELFYCNLCDMSSDQKYLLRRHKREVHGVVEPGGRVFLYINCVSVTDSSILIFIYNSFSDGAIGERGTGGGYLPLNFYKMSAESKLYQPYTPTELSPENVENVCRICLQIDIPLSSIFRNDVDKMISEFVSDKIDEQDQFPHQICEKCLIGVKEAYAFKKKIEYSHEVIKKLLSGKRSIRITRRNIGQVNCQLNISLQNPSSKTCFQCLICNRNLKRKNLLKKHMEKAHKFLRFDEELDSIFDNGKEKIKKADSENNMEQEPLSTFLEVKETDKDGKHSIVKFENETNVTNSNQINIKTQYAKTEKDLKLHLEKQHQKSGANTVDIKAEILLEENSNVNDSFDFGCLTAEQSEEIKDQDLTILNNDISSDYHENNSSTASLDVSQAGNVKSNKTRPKTINAYKCHICEKEFSCRTTTRRHLKNIHKFENFEDDIWLSKVYQKTIEAKIYECEICKKVYAKTQDLFRHQLLHTGNPRAKPYSCTMCSKSFSRSNHLKTHVNGVHADLRPFKCLTCEKSFRRTEHLKRHILICSTGRKRRAKKPTEHRFPCEVCLRKFSTEKAVQDHIDLEHNETREFSCKYCSEKIIGSTEYRKHCKEHYKTSKQFLCSECGGSFRKLQDFKIHLKRHTGEKPFKCQYCDKAFLRPADQHAHERSHTGERNFKCTNCPKAFSTAYKLRVHMRIHTGERPYKCSYCPRAFAKTGDLKIHHKRRHTSERFYCDLCDLGFVQMFNLRQHKRQVHGVDEPPIRTNFVHKVELPPKESSNNITTEAENRSLNNGLSSQAEDEKNEQGNIKNETICEFNSQYGLLTSLYI
ncbi:zinc finger protein Xfin-like [Condylostylus longicornis]|uniref:zinc finger protein Xfin-like n=1 Tax=Condylostylus longicornis TaxID=2530218 RepID=UPI00244E0F69|nr:zinc finger protein Xfin-like [Condylostylus longicornis]